MNKINLQKKWIILFTVLIMTFMATLDGSIVNVALPVMAKELNVTMAAIEWVVTSYLVIICATVLIFGRLGDLKGKVKIFKLGVIGFTVGSLLCGVSINLPILVVSRCIQAIGAAGAMSTNQGIITEVFPPRERGRALGIIGTAVALGSMVGPTLGGLILSVLQWKYIFLINVPMGISGYILSLKTLPKIKKVASESFDIKGSILIFISIVLLFTSITLGQTITYTNPIIIFMFVGACVLGGLFIFLERRIEYPLLDISIFRNGLFSLSIFCGFISFIGMYCSNIILPFYIEDVLSLNPGITGALLTVSPIVLVFVSPVSGYLSDKIGSEILTFIGLLMSSMGLFLMATLNETSPIWTLVIFIVFMSLGNGMFQSPNNSLIMLTVSKDKLGIAGSTNALIRNLGMTMGISIATTILYARMSSKIGYAVVSYVPGRSDVFIYAMSFVYIIAGIICIVGTALTLIRTIRQRKVEKSIK